jgi:Zn-dependent M28 family amino/carboxypeptidase
MMLNRGAVLLLAIAAAAFGQVQGISGERIRAHDKFLSSDLLEGRGVGTRGGHLAAEYIATQFALAGAKPAGDDGTYFQRVPLVGANTEPASTLTAAGNGQDLSFKWFDEFIGVTGEQKPLVDFNAEAIFVGHGIEAPQFQWDDYKGVDVRGKVVVVFTNEPPSNDPKFFGGRALTYFGRWSYKYEEALRRGAVACIIVHTTPTAGYGWDVVSSSWGKENPQMRLAPGEKGLAFMAWITQAAGERLFAMSGHTVDQMLELANSRDFHPIALGVRIRGHILTKVRNIDSRNVVAMVPGSDPRLKDEAVVFTAHWDHLGIGQPVNGDAIYNGAVDNATGCAILLEIARAWASLPEKPKRSAIFVSVTAEEAGLLGSQYFAEHPVFPASKLALDLNFDALQPLGRTKDISVNGAERTTLMPTVEAVAGRFNYTIEPEAHPEQGHYFRSDHFSFARVGVPAFSISQGDQFRGKPADFGEKAFQEFNTKHYHQPSDEYHADWDFSGLEQISRFALALGMDVANQPQLPGWQPGDEFQRK